MREVGKPIGVHDALWNCVFAIEGERPNRLGDAGLGRRRRIVARVPIALVIVVGHTLRRPRMAPIACLTVTHEIIEEGVVLGERVGVGRIPPPVQ